MTDFVPSPAFAHVVITGATSGLGAALATLYATPGRTLSLSGRNVVRLNGIAEVCRAKGALVETMAIDVTNAAAMQGWLHMRDDVLTVDLVIASAGIGGATVVPSSAAEGGELAREIISINTVGVINTVTPLIPRFVARHAGALVLIGSISGGIGLPQSPAYCASKAAVQIYGDGLRRLLRQHGVRVTNVLPGFVDTPMSQSLELPRPFCWPVDNAARRIARDIDLGRRQSVFPWQLRLAIGLQHVLPLALTDFILSRSARSD